MGEMGAKAACFRAAVEPGALLKVNASSLIAQSESRCSDYGRWVGKETLFRWASLQEFIQGTSLEAGLHVVETGCLPLELLIHEHGDSLRGAGPIPVFFGGAVTDRGSKSPPFFSGVELARSLGKSSVFVSDPSLSLASDLALSWYSGTQWQDVRGQLVELLRAISNKLDRDLLLVGGSGGGYSALSLGSDLGPRGAALVWNPQTDWLKYYRGAVDKYLDAAFPDITNDDDPSVENFSKRLGKLGVRHSVVDPNFGMPRRLLYLQNSSDFHTQVHAAPFLKAHDFVRVELDLYKARRGQCVLMFGAWGDGHAVPPKEVIAACVQGMCRTDVTPLEWLRGEGAPVTKQIRHAESAPSSTHFGDVLKVSLEVTRAFGGVAATARSLGAEQFREPASYAFYAHRNGEKVAQQWYGQGSQVYFPDSADGQIDRITAFARDGFGDLAGTASSTIEKTKRNSLKKFVILGSCVTRDAFALGAPLVDYFARTSLISAFPHSDIAGRLHLDLSSIDSAFQRRMVDFDLGKKLQDHFKNIDFDYLVLDLIDERFSLLKSGDGYVTLSPEFVRSGYMYSNADLLAPDDALRWDLWRGAVKRLLAAVPANKIVVNRVYWADKDETGRELVNQGQIRNANLCLARMYGFLGAFDGMLGIDYPEELLVANSKHKWGLSPFHYISPFYYHTLVSLGRIAE